MWKLIVSKEKNTFNSAVSFWIAPSPEISTLLLHPGWYHADNTHQISGLEMLIPPLQILHMRKPRSVAVDIFWESFFIIS